VLEADVECVCNCVSGGGAAHLLCALDCLAQRRQAGGIRQLHRDVLDGQALHPAVEILLLRRGGDGAGTPEQ